MGNYEIRGLIRRLKKTRTIIFIASIWYLTSGICFSSGEDAGLPGNYLYSFSANARALGMGRAYTAIAFDSSASYWNPAGLARLVCTEGSFLYVPLFEDTVYYFLGAGYPVSYGNVIGISIAGLQTGGVENTEYGSVFDDKHNAYILSYARTISKLDLGINLKAVNHKMDIYFDTGFGIDIGSQYKYGKLFLGASIQNILRPHLKLKNETDKFPTNLKIGAGYKFFNEKALGVFDLDFINILGDRVHPVRWHLGVEYNPYKLFFIRTGLDYKEVTFGFGIKSSNFSLDYAFGIHTLGPSHRFSFSGRFGLLPTEAQKLIDEKQREANIKINYANGLEAFSQKNYALAKQELNKTLKLAPEYEQAKKLLNKVIISEQCEEARDLYIMALEEKRKGDEAFANELIIQAKVLDKKVEGKLEEEFFFKAHAALRIKEYKKAKEQLENVLQINPDNTEARDLLIKLEFILQFTE